MNNQMYNLSRTTKADGCKETSLPAAHTVALDDSLSLRLQRFVNDFATIRLGVDCPEE